MSNQAHTIISGHSHTFDTGIAETLGLHAAIVFNHIVYWLKINCRKENANFHEGKYWMYETQKQMADFFGYLKEDDVWKAIKKLLDAGLLVKGNFNSNPFDKTAWYTTIDQEIFLGKKGIKEKITKPLNSGIGDAQQRNPTRPQAECNIQEDKQEDNQKEHHQKSDDDLFFSDSEKEELNNYSEQEISEAMRILKDMCCQQKNSSRVKFFFTTIRNLKQSPKKVKIPPAEELKKHFKHGEFYNQAECYINETHIGFGRGMRHESVDFKYFTWENFQKMCDGFGIKFTR